MIDRQLREQMLTEFDGERHELEDVRPNLEKLIKDRLNDTKVVVHLVIGRIKDRDKLEQKLERPDSKYESLRGVHDVVGLRVITYFEDTIAAVERALRQVFDVDEEKSGDRGKRLGEREFGYKSFHLIAKLSSKLTDLQLYGRVMENRYIEIQIRSLLQHAWAEIEHDLGYKNPNAVPAPIRRQFSRVAAFLEVADEDFCRVRNDLKEYEKAIASKLHSDPEKFDINASSLRAFLKSDRLRELDAQIAQVAGARIVDADPSVIEKYVSRLQALGVLDIGALEQEVQKHGGDALRFAREQVAGAKADRVQAGTGLYYVLFIILAERVPSTISEHLHQFMIGPVARRASLVNRLVSYGSRQS